MAPVSAQWHAVWAPDTAHVCWELTVTDQRGNVAMRERTATPVTSLHPRDGFLVTLGLCPAGDWEPGGRGSLRCPVIVTSAGREDALLSALLASGRSVP